MHYICTMSKKYTEQIEMQTLKLYSSGMEIREICRTLGVYKDYPSIVAKKYNIARGSGKASNINPELFNLSTPESQYWVGYIIADGNISVVQRSHRLSLATIDLEIKEKFLNYCSANYYYQSNKLHVMYFSSKIICSNLIELGIVPKKSKTISLKFPLTSHILRGIFDGDGSVHNKKQTCKITTGSFELGNQIVDYLSSVGIYSKLRLRIGTSHYDVWVERKSEFKKFFSFLYQDSTENTRLNRKYIKFVALLSNG